MPPQITAFFGRLGNGAKNFTGAQKFLAAIGIAVLVLGTVALTSWMTKPAMTPLFSGLQAADASAVVEQLRKDNVPFELTGGGNTILVPEEHVYDERLKAAQAGLPTATATGYNLLDKMGVTASEFQQNVTYKRALEGELGSTISAMDGVKSASVRLAIPEKTVFVANVSDPTASVFLETNPGQALDTDKVQAIVHLTSSAIENLKPTNVSVVDAAGNVLSAVGTGTAGTADKKATDYEQRVSTAVKTVLDRVVGPGNATVAVAADVTQESAQRTQETFANAEGTAPLNESTKTEEYTGTGGAATGVLGPDNIAVPGGGEGNGTFNSEESTRNNAVNKTTEDRTIPAGALNRQTVSVAIDREAAAQVDVQALQALVASAAGINAERGDQVTVQVVPFSTAAADAAAEALAADEAARQAAEQAEFVRNIIIGGVVALIALVILLVLTLRNRRQRREPVALDPEPLPVLPLEPETSAIVQLPPLQPVQEIEPLPAPDEDVLSIEKKRAQIGKLATDEPAKTADYLRSMMTEEKANA